MARLKTLFDSKYVESNQAYNVLTTQLKTNVERAKNVTNGQILYLKSIIADAQKSAANSSTTLSCIKTQETLVNKLNTNSLSNCYPSSNISLLYNVKYNYTRLSSVSANTFYWCQNLNPIESQNEPLRDCVSSKINDLNSQVNLIEANYYSLSNGTLTTSVKCLTEGATTTLTTLGQISYELSLCVFRLK